MLPKTFLLVLFIRVCGLIETARAQTYAMQSVEGIKTRIKIAHGSNDENVTIYCLHDSLKLRFYNNMQDVSVFQNKFLQITYGVHAGSDIASTNLLLLCVSKGKLCQALHITSFINASMKAVDTDTDTLVLDEHRFFQSKSHLTGTNKSNYRFNINLQDKSTSKSDPKTNYNIDTTMVLNFDTDKHVFYSDHRAVSQYFSVYDYKTSKDIKRYFKGTFPVIKIRQNITYYFIKGEWYNRSNNNQLSKDAYK
jgi:hypothetical protein